MSSEISIIEIGKRLMQLRNELNLTQNQFAELLNIKPTTYQRYEKGVNEPPLSIANKISEMGFNLTWFLTGNGSPHLDDAPGPINKLRMSDDEFRDFIDKPRARNIKNALVDLERLDTETFRRVESYIKGTVDTVREVSDRGYGKKKRINEE